MAGTIIPLISKRQYAFTGTSTVIVAKAIGCVGYTSGTLLVRVHAVTISAGTIEVFARVASPSSDEPQTDFVLSTAAATATLNSGSSAPSLIRAAVTADFGAFLEISVKGTFSSGTLQATISADLVLKD